MTMLWQRTSFLHLCWRRGIDGTSSPVPSRPWRNGRKPWTLSTSMGSRRKRLVSSNYKTAPSRSRLGTWELLGRPAAFPLDPRRTPWPTIPMPARRQPALPQPAVAPPATDLHPRESRQTDTTGIRADSSSSLFRIPRRVRCVLNE